MRICNKKRVRQLLLALFIIALCPVISFAVISPTNDFYVNDYANVLSEETENHILRASKQLETETSAQICVLTVNTLDGADVFEYSLEVFRDWGIGDEEKDNGVLILLSVEDRQMWITTGYGVEGTLNDGKLGRFRDEYATPYYSNGDYDQGTKALFDVILNSLRVEEYGLEPYGDGNYEYNYSDETDISSEDAKGVLKLIVIPVVAFIVLIIYQDLKYLRLKQYDKLHGTDRAIIYRLHCHEMRHSILQLVFFFFLRGGRGGGSGGGNRGGGGSSGGGGAGGSF